MHPKNRHQSRYDLKALCSKTPRLSSFVMPNKYGDESIDFANPEAVKCLNQAILKYHYNLDWDLPPEFLCPPIPGRADYIHVLSDLLESPEKNLRVLDIGVGANCIYPLLGFSEYGWDFVGSDINPQALSTAQRILDCNPNLKDHIELRQQKSDSIFKGIISFEESFTFTMCNPPFHASLEDAIAGTTRKWKNLGKKTRVLNFGGQGAELWTEGGEKAFIKKMVEESVEFSKSVTWFTTLVSKEDNLPSIYSILRKVKAREVKTLDMTQGQKKSRVVAWRY